MRVLRRTGGAALLVCMKRGNMKKLIRDVRIVTGEGIGTQTDILIEDNLIREIGQGLATTDALEIDASGLLAFGGFVDLHCHLRDPGLTYKEDIASGTRAAAAGGYTAVCCMPNTKPVIDTPEVLQYITEQQASARVLPVACITQGMQGQVLTDFEALARSGAVAFSDDGMPVAGEALLREAMCEARGHDRLLMLHEEDLAQRGNGVVNDCETARAMGYPVIPKAVEELPTQRDLALAQETGARVHICHVSTRGSLDAIRTAKRAGARVTCESAPHYIALDDTMLASGNTNLKVNPPIRSKDDVQAVIEALCDGTIDAIGTDHAPHAAEEKARSMQEAPFGLIGLETAFAVVHTCLVRTGKLGYSDLARLFCEAPRRILGMNHGRLQKNAIADLVLVDPNKEFVYCEQNIVSKAKNSPYLGQTWIGKPVLTMCEGVITYDNRQAD